MTRCDCADELDQPRLQLDATHASQTDHALQFAVAPRAAIAKASPVKRATEDGGCRGEEGACLARGVAAQHASGNGFFSAISGTE